MKRLAITRTLGISTEAVRWVFLFILLGVLSYPLPFLSIFFLLCAAYSIYFFRDPVRITKLDTDSVYAGSDGTVMAVETVKDEQAGKGSWTRIVVFLSLFDVHINRSPVAGEIKKIHAVSGGYYPANSFRSEHNHAVYTTIQGTHGVCIVVQRVGFIARRIVHWFPVGHNLKQGERFGLIRFGSRTDIYLTEGKYVVSVKPGDKVTGGVTVVAHYNAGGSLKAAPE